MIEINGKHLCENCFEENEATLTGCPHCGYKAGAGMSDPTMLTPGSILLGKYIIGKEMGKGGFGITYLAFDVTANKKVAIKEFFPYGVALRANGTATVTVTNSENADAFKIGAEKFYNEAKLVSKFNGNPNIVGVYEFFYENDTVYFAMEYLKGHTLKEHIDKNGPLSAPQALFIAQSVANALMAAHSSNVLHRDISPDNIIICDNGDVKLIDFGAARQVVAEHSQSFSVILKPGFAPLEQYQKKGKQGPWTDIYSLGATLYYTLTEDIPDDPMSRMSDDEEYSSNMYNINPELWRVISRATQLKIEDRYGDIFQLKNDLSTVTIEAAPLVVPPAGEAEQMPEFRTAMPYGMTQAQQAQPVQPVQQPVSVGAPTQPSVPPTGYYQTTPEQPTAAAQEAVPAAKKPISKKTAAIAISGAVAAAAAAIIIPISVNSAKNSGGSKPAYTPSPTYSSTANNSTPTYSSAYNSVSSTPATGVDEETRKHMEAICSNMRITAQNFATKVKSDTGKPCTGDSMCGLTLTTNGNMAYKIETEFSDSFKVKTNGAEITLENGDVTKVIYTEGEYTAVWTKGSNTVEVEKNASKTAKLGGAWVDGVGAKKEDKYATTKVTDQEYSYNGKTVTYTGDWKNGKPEGQGKCVWPNGDTYEGGWVNGEASGYGTETFIKDGGMYVGEFKNRLHNGQGKFSWPDGEYYDGEWKDGKRCGYGKYVYAVGGYYEGEWENNDKNGQGKLVKSNGDTYEGTWKNNALYNGTVTFYSANGTVLGKDTYKNGKKV